MRNFGCIILFVLLCFSCSNSSDTDWRDKYTGEYEGRGNYTSWALERENQWAYLAKIHIRKNTESSDGLIIKRGRISTFSPEKWSQSYFETSLEYQASMDLKGNLIIPMQDVKADNIQSNELRYVIHQEENTAERKVSFGQWKNDTLMIALSFSGKDIRDSIIVVKK